ncbi:MAG TPA: peptidase C39 family protein, partial [Chloroflexia bacterium]|nr:peptidase C39 family protein [Chloroflexia bacterium]
REVEAAPSVTNASVVVSTTPSNPARLAAGSRARWGKTLAVPECSQMVYPDGGEVWCSPTSVAMVLGYWAGESGPCEPGVRSAVAGVYDRIYRGHGNWPFNAAYAASRGMEAYVTRFTGLAQAEEWIAAGVPVIMSIGWGRGQLSGAPIASSSGHLLVLAGFDAQGNPVVNDPAAPSDQSVQRTYRRAQFERLWLARSGGTAYVIYPEGHAVPRL